MREKILKILKNYKIDKIKIGTLGSHSALNILRGAKDEGFDTVCICKKEDKKIYENFGVADKVIEVEDFKMLLDRDVQEYLRKENVILIPHGSFNAYIGKFDELLVPIFGNRELMEWEIDREKQRIWLERARVRMPKRFSRPEEIDRVCIVKFMGARGGRGYFLAKDAKDFYDKAKKFVEMGLARLEDLSSAEIQEYVVGATVYFSFFYSPINERIELISIDRRYEVVDALGKVPAEIQLGSEIYPTYTVIGNFPLVLRESLLRQAFEFAERIVEVSKEIAYPGMVGPFCVESVFNNNAEMIVFEISARIVAGTNVGIPFSPYSYILFGEFMYMGRRIAREIKVALEKGMLEDLIY
ncbi:MAG: formate--phosphoribosylaminoimidazolecarboxamide ligase [Archaeoglobaceae archaeon]|nr:formate--phosphoribosylaminoimidazolecarboxamide ligase [Archaeoglobaceae archaeon]MCX8152077.1 formate--phosphoribosylaminoimidazolecarboxamide ligase [Archaeoglobaceae archaeon]MDW8013512.1 formate--phosphoribosylaminoimidazolecarboxamide ligase [Archaeoglobaceae archaeon]